MKTTITIPPLLCSACIDHHDAIRVDYHVLESKLIYSYYYCPTTRLHVFYGPDALKRKNAKTAAVMVAEGKEVPK